MLNLLINSTYSPKPLNETLNRVTVSNHKHMHLSCQSPAFYFLHNPLRTFPQRWRFYKDVNANWFNSNSWFTVHKYYMQYVLSLLPFFIIPLARFHKDVVSTKMSMQTNQIHTCDLWFTVHKYHMHYVLSLLLC